MAQRLGFAPRYHAFGERAIIYIIFTPAYGTGGGIRTLTSYAHWILSPECLPITPRLHILLVEVTGFEPVASWSQTKHSAPTELNLEIYFSFIFYIYYIKNFKKNQITEK